MYLGPKQLKLGSADNHQISPWNKDNNTPSIGCTSIAMSIAIATQRAFKERPTSRQMFNFLENSMGNCV